MKTYTEEQFLSFISDSFMLNQEMVTRNVYIELVSRLINDAKQIIQKHSADQFFILAIPFNERTHKAVLQYFSQFQIFVFNKTYGRTEELGLIHVITEDNLIVEAVDA